MTFNTARFRPLKPRVRSYEIDILFGDGFDWWIVGIADYDDIERVYTVTARRSDVEDAIFFRNPNDMRADTVDSLVVKSLDEFVEIMELLRLDYLDHALYGPDE